MSDLGNIGRTIKPHTGYLGDQIDSKLSDYLIYWNRLTNEDKETGKILLDSTYMQCTKIPYLITIPWFMKPGINTVNIVCELSAFAVSNNPTSLPTAMINTNIIKTGLATSAPQTLEISYSLQDPNPKIIMLSLYYYNEWHYDSTCKWNINNTNGIIDSPINTISEGSSAASNCSYPIGEEQPIDYGLIELSASGTKTLTFTIPSGTVASNIVDAQILLTLSPYGSNANGNIEDIFTELSSAWDRLYVYDILTSLKINIETWNDVDNFAKVWVTIPLLTTAAKDIILDFNILNVTNTDSTIFTLIGF